MHFVAAACPCQVSHGPEVLSRNQASSFFRIARSRLDHRASGTHATVIPTMKLLPAQSSLSAVQAAALEAAHLDN